MKKNSVRYFSIESIVANEFISDQKKKKKDYKKPTRASICVYIHTSIHMYMYIYTHVYIYKTQEYVYYIYIPDINV